MLIGIIDTRMYDIFGLVIHFPFKQLGKIRVNFFPQDNRKLLLSTVANEPLQ